MDALVSEHLPELGREELTRVVALHVADEIVRAAVSPQGLHRLEAGQELGRLVLRLRLLLQQHKELEPRVVIDHDEDPPV